MNTQKMTRILTFALMTASLFLTTASGAERARIGEPAPDFTLTDTSGNVHSLKSYRGRIAVLGFLGVACPISNAYNDRIRAFVTDYSPGNVAFLGINSNYDEPVPAIRAHIEKNGFSFPVLKDVDNKVSDSYGAERTPEMFVIDQDGVLRYRGRIDNSQELRRVKRNDLRAALDELMSGKPVTIPEARAFGCLIKRAADAEAINRVEEQAKDFSPKVGRLKPADFAKFKAASLGKVLVINFWATWCGPCVAEFPEFVALDAKYRDKGVKFVGISADEISDIDSKVIPFIKEQKAMFEMMIQDTDDPEEMIAVVDKEWQGTLPATFIFDKTGKLSYVRYGIIDRDLLIEAIEKAMK
ncbi:MAG: redoxin domain-containing protein [Blastocatellales bacterium]